jgi:hypothetical protein
MTTRDEQPELPRFDGKTALEHAETAAEALRALNHITAWPGGGLAYLADAHAVLGSLSVLAMRLPQACGQLASQLQKWHAAGRVGIDRGTRYADDPGLAVSTACQHLTDDAPVAAHQLHDALDAAHSAITYAHYLDHPTNNDPDTEHGTSR